MTRSFKRFLGRKINRRLVDLFLIKRLGQKPLSDVFGFDRGQPIDRYYIEKFLGKYRSDIRGTGVEVGDLRYLDKFGDDRVERKLILNVSANATTTDLVCNLETGAGLQPGIADTLIVAQTLQFLYDPMAAIQNSLTILKPGGKLFISVPGISQISVRDADEWGEYWRWTEHSLRRVLEEFVPSEGVVVECYGNVKSAAAFLYGLSSHELRKEELDHHDPRYNVLICAIIKKC